MLRDFELKQKTYKEKNLKHSYHQITPLCSLEVVSAQTESHYPDVYICIFTVNAAVQLALKNDLLSLSAEVKLFPNLQGKTGRNTKKGKDFDSKPT